MAADERGPLLFLPWTAWPLPPFLSPSCRRTAKLFFSGFPARRTCHTTLPGSGVAECNAIPGLSRRPTSPSRRPRPRQGTFSGAVQLERTLGPANGSPSSAIQLLVIQEVAARQLSRLSRPKLSAQAGVCVRKSPRQGTIFHASPNSSIIWENCPRGHAVRHDLQGFILDYLDAAGIRDEAKERPIFRTVIRKTKQFTGNAMTAGDMTRMLKRRLKAAALPLHLSPHSFRVTTITNLLEQGVGLEEVQRLAGHADPRTTRLYDRRDKKITRNIVERISI